MIGAKLVPRLRTNRSHKTYSKKPPYKIIKIIRADYDVHIVRYRGHDDSLV